MYGVSAQVNKVQTSTRVKDKLALQEKLSLRLFLQGKVVGNFRALCIIVGPYMVLLGLMHCRWALCGIIGPYMWLLGLSCGCSSPDWGPGVLVQFTMLAFRRRVVSGGVKGGKMGHDFCCGPFLWCTMWASHFMGSPLCSSLLYPPVKQIWTGPHPSREGRDTCGWLSWLGMSWGDGGRKMNPTSTVDVVDGGFTLRSHAQ